MDNTALAQTVVELAKDTIQYLALLNSKTNVYRRLQVFYHQFLTSAIAVLFLASTHAPLHFSVHCRGEFYMALELVKDMSARSWVSQRLWRTIRSLKAIAPRLGLAEDDSNAPPAVSDQVNGPGSSSAGSVYSPRRMGTPLERSFVGLRPPHSVPSPSSTHAVHVPSPAEAQHAGGGQDDPRNGMRLRSEMTRIFEGYAGMNYHGAASVPVSRVHSQSPDVGGPGRIALGAIMASETGEVMNGHGLGVGGPAIGAGGGGRCVGGSSAGEHGLNGSVYQHLRDMF
jgi:hypothetical protein